MSKRKTLSAVKGKGSKMELAPTESLKTMEEFAAEDWHQHLQPKALAFRHSLASNARDTIGLLDMTNPKTLLPFVLHHRLYENFFRTPATVSEARISTTKVLAPLESVARVAPLAQALTASEVRDHLKAQKSSSNSNSTNNSSSRLNLPDYIMGYAARPKPRTWHEHPRRANEGASQIIST
ncbi:uncharacterized protein MONBRDRAFT_7142 [Monosiga brevicollis MX1]|uniref:Uncharacterized protein n=1 Tax=Monosiga brevicollis TaxID=81824 RepID=A9UW22_MONBE|nr:uncharacterized protein MONBRDRAFT_7142 [Monosiga brevicollis MX1]EDQ90486.1 predicted protein [Monosiga brevicollis MX1]|eukprot:XP_001744537.1 hypothetical protein [Monosiga brevicollis MX1]